MKQNPESLAAPFNKAHIPKVSIGMPVYNGEKYMREALDSVLAQTFTDFELVISDNASTDGTEAICREYMSKDVRIKYIKQQPNIGALNNFNYLLEHARGNYFTWLAHDDYLDASFFEVVVQYLDEHSDVVLCSGDFRVVRDGATLRTVTLDEIRDNKDWTYVRRKFFTYSHDLCFPIYGMYRLCIMHKYNIYGQTCFMGMASGIEYTILPKVALQGRIVSLPNVLRTYRIRDDSLSGSEGKDIRRFFLLLNVIYIILKYHARVIIFSKLTIRRKMDILFEIFPFDVLILFGYTLACIPERWQRTISNVKGLQPLRNKIRHWMQRV